MNNTKTNWLRFTTILSKAVINTIESLTDSDTNLIVKSCLSKKFMDSVKKRRGCSKYLLSVDVMVGKEQLIPARIVCVRNKKNRKD